MLHRLDLNQLRVLEVLLATANVKQTAERIGASQASVSRSLGKLRVMFNDPLLLKTRDGMMRTKRGEDIASALSEWLAATHELERLSGLSSPPTDPGETLAPDRISKD